MQTMIDGIVSNQAGLIIVRNINSFEIMVVGYNNELRRYLIQFSRLCGLDLERLRQLEILLERPSNVINQVVVMDDIVMDLTGWGLVDNGTCSDYREYLEIYRRGPVYRINDIVVTNNVNDVNDVNDSIQFISNPLPLLPSLSFSFQNFSNNDKVMSNFINDIKVGGLDIDGKKIESFRRAQLDNISTIDLLDI